MPGDRGAARGVLRRGREPLPPIRSGNQPHAQDLILQSTPVQIGPPNDVVNRIRLSGHTKPGYRGLSPSIPLISPPLPSPSSRPLPDSLASASDTFRALLPGQVASLGSSARPRLPHACYKLL